MKVIILGNRIPVGDWATSLPCCAFWLGFTRGETVANSWRHTRATSWVYFVLVIFWGMANLKHSHAKHCLFDLFIHCLIAFISNSFTVIKNCHHHLLLCRRLLLVTPLTGSGTDSGVSGSPANCLKEATLSPLCYPKGYWAEL